MTSHDLPLTSHDLPSQVPRALFHDLYALCDAQRRGELPDGSEAHFNELLQSLSLEVQQGHLGKKVPP